MAEGITRQTKVCFRRLIRQASFPEADIPTDLLLSIYRYDQECILFNLCCHAIAVVVVVIGAIPDVVIVFVVVSVDVS